MLLVSLFLNTKVKLLHVGHVRKSIHILLAPPFFILTGAEVQSKSKAVGKSDIVRIKNDLEIITVCPVRGGETPF